MSVWRGLKKIWGRNRRYASLPNIMKAKKKPMEKKKLSDYNIEFKKRLETIQVVGTSHLPSSIPQYKLLISGRTGTPKGRWKGRER